jgi:methylated-DNA-protein-cysteine methyltransferase-like protein
MKTIKLSEENADFFDRVYEVVKLIPAGRATSYGAIASYLGAKRSSRMVGWAMNAAHTKPEIPAHRVVNRNGQLTGKMHFRTPTFMQESLEKEGIIIEDDQIKDWKTIFWNPNSELEI